MDHQKYQLLLDAGVSPQIIQGKESLAEEMSTRFAPFKGTKKERICLSKIQAVLKKGYCPDASSITTEYVIYGCGGVFAQVVKEGDKARFNRRFGRLTLRIIQTGSCHSAFPDKVRPLEPKQEDLDNDLSILEEAFFGFLDLYAPINWAVVPKVWKYQVSDCAYRTNSKDSEAAPGMGIVRELTQEELDTIRMFTILSAHADNIAIPRWIDLKRVLLNESLFINNCLDDRFINLIPVRVLTKQEQNSDPRHLLREEVEWMLTLSSGIEKELAIYGCHLTDIQVHYDASLVE